MLKCLKINPDLTTKKFIFNELENKRIKTIDLETVFLLVGLIRERSKQNVENSDDED